MPRRRQVVNPAQLTLAVPGVARPVARPVTRVSDEPCRDCGGPSPRLPGWRVCADCWRRNRGKAAA
jgi:hypothetical protein